MIVVEGLSKGFKGGQPLFSDLSLSLKPGEICGLVGLNGVGKTTFLRTLLGIFKPDTGSISVFGKDPALSDGSFYRDIGAVLESDGFYGNLSFKENLLFFGLIKGLSEADITSYALAEWGMLWSRSEPIKRFSKGQKMQAAIARAFLGTPNLLVFDEPTAPLDSEGRHHLFSLVKRASDRGATVVISSHQLDAIENLCSSVLFLENGTMEKRSLREGAAHFIIRSDFIDIDIPPLLKTIEGVNSYSLSQNNLSVEISSRTEIAPLIKSLVLAGFPIFEVRDVTLSKKGIL